MTIDCGLREGSLRADHSSGALFSRYEALIARALLLAVTGQMTPEQAADSVVSVFLQGRNIGTRGQLTPPRCMHERDDFPPAARST